MHARETASMVVKNEPDEAVDISSLGRLKNESVYVSGYDMKFEV